jgi:hypothetical protein
MISSVTERSIPRPSQFITDFYPIILRHKCCVADGVALNKLKNIPKLRFSFSGRLFILNTVSLWSLLICTHIYHIIIYCTSGSFSPQWTSWYSELLFSFWWSQAGMLVRKPAVVNF